MALVFLRTWVIYYARILNFIEVSGVQHYNLTSVYTTKWSRSSYRSSYHPSPCSWPPSPISPVPGCFHVCLYIVYTYCFSLFSSYCVCVCVWAGEVGSGKNSFWVAILALAPASCPILGELFYFLGISLLISKVGTAPHISWGYYGVGWDDLCKTLTRCLVEGRCQQVCIILPQGESRRDVAWSQIAWVWIPAPSLSAE